MMAIIIRCTGKQGQLRFRAVGLEGQHHASVQGLCPGWEARKSAAHASDSMTFWLARVDLLESHAVRTL